MQMKYKYVLYGKPLPLLRPRTSFIKRLIYDPQKIEKEQAQQQLRLQHKTRPVIHQPIHLEVTFFMPPPTSMTKTKKAFLYKSPHFKKPDLSNLIKFIEDVAQGIIFQDDSRIISINAKKLYDEHPRTEFTIHKDNE